MKLIATLILICLMAIGLGMALAKHGEPKKERWNFWVQFIATIIEVILFYYAGLFDVFIK